MDFTLLQKTGSVLLGFAGILLIPLLIAAVVGWPTWFLARARTEYLTRLGGYRAAVGLPVDPPPPCDPLVLRGSRWYARAVMLLVVAGWIHPDFGFVVLLLLCSALGFGFSRRVRNSWLLLRANPGLEPRLRLVPRMEMAAYGSIALLAFVLFYSYAVAGPAHRRPDPFKTAAFSSTVNRQAEAGG